LTTASSRSFCEVSCVVIGSGRGSARAEDAQGTPTQSHIHRRVYLLYEDFREKTENIGRKAPFEIVGKPPWICLEGFVTPAPGDSISGEVTRFHCRASGTHKTVNARFWNWRSGSSPSHPSKCSLLTRQQIEMWFCALRPVFRSGRKRSKLKPLSPGSRVQ